MIESKLIIKILAVPTFPFEYFTDITKINDSFTRLYEFMNEKIGKNNYLSVSVFPTLGVDDDYFKPRVPSSVMLDDSEEINDTFIKLNGKDKNQNEFYSKRLIESNHVTRSSQLHDQIINSHPRFSCLARNIRERRGKKVEIKIPLFKDVNTNMNADDEPFPGYIYMDAMGYGMGSNCLQVTLGTSTINATCYLYDQMIPITPLLLALSSSGPIFKGKLSGYDNRFNIVMQAVDDRTDEEKDENSPKYIYKSRYSPAYSYISSHVYSQDFHNDYPKFPINKEFYEIFTKKGMNHKLAEHFCNLLVRDPLAIFDQKIFVHAKSDNAHFENFNSTNWNSLRFKLPRPEDNDSCFKVEVRPCDLQLTPFENSSLVILMLALYGAILEYDVNFIIPITKVDENFERAYKMDSIVSQKFWWRINGLEKNPDKSEGAKYNYLRPSKNVSESLLNKEEDMKNIKELTIAQIFLGSEEHNYPGLLSICEKTLKEYFKLSDTLIHVNLDFISKRATGEIMTDARYIRNFVMNHPQYKHDSIVTKEIAYDLIKQLLKIQNGEERFF